MIKKLLFYACKWTGCFNLARRLTRGALRILAYHGFALCDENLFLPHQFMDARVFRQRMDYLVHKNYPVLPLGKAIEHLRPNNLPPNATVITFDDGFYSTWKKAVPVLQEFKLPCTIYVTTYYCVKENPVFRLVVRYMFWKTTKVELDLTGLGLEERGKVRFPDAVSKENITWRVVNYGENQMEEDHRVQLCQELGKRLGVDYSEIVQKRFLTLMTKEDIRKAGEAGIDIQLHTHRHNLPFQREIIRREIEQNRAVLQPLLDYIPRHFCYPSGIYTKGSYALLTELNVISAATCDSGFNYPDTPPLALFRFLDGNTISWIEFEAEMSGFAELLRKVRSRIKQVVSRPHRQDKGCLGTSMKS